MASLHLGAASLINESWVVFGSSLKLRIGFRSKRFRRVAERWMFRVQQMSMKDDELARSAKRSESLRYILKQYGLSVEEYPEVNKPSDDLSCEEKHDAVPSSVIDDDSKMKTTEELPDLRREEQYHESVSVSTVDNLSGHQHNKFSHLNTGALFTSLLPVLGFCIVLIIGTLHTIISRKTSRGHHHGSKRTRWRSALSDWNEPIASEEHDSSAEYRVGSANQEATDEAYSRVELEYKRFLLECGVSES
ncbi:unnamed protein product [Thlaspi arvense]|uniref:Transmembrane protein n=1 Tax=Thlaspi arvense TaxID=13288 RepID=A0AAU9SUI9_THLAR|nr:unnamed protein product [Thlaspi arvense]